MFLLSPIAVTLNQGQGQLDEYQNVECKSIYQHTKFESNIHINLNACQLFFCLFCLGLVFFLGAGSKPAVISLLSVITLKNSMGMYNLNCFNTMLNFSFLS